MAEENFKKQKEIQKKLSEAVQRFSNLPLKSVEQAMKNAAEIYKNIPQPVFDQLKRLSETQKNLVKNFPKIPGVKPIESIQISKPIIPVTAEQFSNYTISVLKQNNELIKLNKKLLIENKKAGQYNKRMFWVAILSLIVAAISLIIYIFK